MRRADKRNARWPSAGASTLCLASIAVLWIVFVGGTRRDETITGAGVLLLSSAFLFLVWRVETLNLELTLQDLAQGWRVPWYILADNCEIVAIFVKDLLQVRKAGSYYRVSGFETSRSDARLAGRRVLAIFYTSMSPSLIVLGIDSRQGRMLFHQLKRSGIPKMTKALGAQPGGQR